MTKCTKTPANELCPENKICSPFDLVDGNNCVIADYVEESLNIGGAVLNVFKLLGIHEQGTLVDLTNGGTAISSGSAQGHGADASFTEGTCQWHSTVVGQAVISSGFIGYDFGIVKLDNGRSRYGIDVSIRQHIATIKIKQHNNSNNRITKARVERSEDNVKWYGVDIISIPDDGDEHTIHFKQSASSRYWRLRPITFNGVSSNSFWGVERLQLIDYTSTALSNIQDELGFLENRDRDYSSQSIRIKAHYDLMDVQSDLSKWGIGDPLTQEFYFTVSFNGLVSAIGRPLVIGDILEVPSEVQFSAELKPVRKYLEVTDVTWSAEGYTPGWKPTLQRITAQPMLASQETQDIVGDLAGIVDNTGFLDIDDEIYQDVLGVDDNIQAAAQNNVPEHGEDVADIAEIPQNVIDAAGDLGPNLEKLNINTKGIYIEDALPSNGAPYTVGFNFPNNANDGDYHRLTYEQGDIPPRLYRYSLIKNRWLYLETDRRAEYNARKPTLQQYISGTSIPPSKIGK